MSLNLSVLKLNHPKLFNDSIQTRHAHNGYNKCLEFILIL